MRSLGSAQGEAAGGAEKVQLVEARSMLVVLGYFPFEASRDLLGVGFGVGAKSELVNRLGNQGLRTPRMCGGIERRFSGSPLWQMARVNIERCAKLQLRGILSRQ